MGYYKVLGRQLAECPINATLEDGSTVFNYHLLPAERLEADGWKSEIVEDPLPEYDPEEQMAVSWYEDCGTYIARRWELRDVAVQLDPEEMAEALRLLGVDVTGGDA